MKLGNTTIKISQGDILQYPAEAIILPLDAGGLWVGGYHQTLQFAGVNGALQGLTGLWFHTRAAEQVLAQHGAPIVRDGQAIFVSGAACSQRGNFRDVIFVLDNLFYPLSEIVASGLKAAYEAKLEAVSLPLIRSGVMTITAHFTVEELISEMARGIRLAIEAYQEQFMAVTVLITADADVRWKIKLPQILQRSEQILRLKGQKRNEEAFEE